MLVEVFAVYDSKARNYGQPFFCINPAIAIRAFQSTVESPESQLHKYPEDFSLFHLASFNDETGEFTARTNPTNLGLASQFKMPVYPAQPKE